MKKSCVPCKSRGRPLIVLLARTSFVVKDVGYGEGDQGEGSSHGALKTRNPCLLF
jgi:hypothetical protein